LVVKERDNQPKASIDRIANVFKSEEYPISTEYPADFGSGISASQTTPQAAPSPVLSLTLLFWQVCIWRRGLIMEKSSNGFRHRLSADGSYDSICIRCFRTVARQEKLPELTTEEKAHVCNSSDLNFAKVAKQEVQNDL
jgi:hypothetical protein